MTDRIDFCISFIGENVGVLSRVFFGTLGRHCPLAGVALHLVNKQVSGRMWGQVLEAAGRLACPVRAYDLDTGWCPYRGAVDAFSYDPDRAGTGGRPVPAGNDAAATAEWVVDNCGDADWCVLSHFDVVWLGDVVGRLRALQESSGAMMVGGHCPIMLLNRPAYRRCGVGFDVDGTVDVGVALGIALGAAPVEPDPNKEQYFHHLGGGGGYHTAEEFRSMRERAQWIADTEMLP